VHRIAGASCLFALAGCVSAPPPPAIAAASEGDLDVELFDWTDDALLHDGATLYALASEDEFLDWSMVRLAFQVSGVAWEDLAGARLRWYVETERTDYAAERWSSTWYFEQTGEEVPVHRGPMSNRMLHWPWDFIEGDTWPTGSVSLEVWIEDAAVEIPSLFLDDLEVDVSPHCFIGDCR